MKIKMLVNWNPVLQRHRVGSSVAGAKEIAAWMSDDLPRGQDSINDWLEQFSAVARGEVEEGYLGTGNAHHVRVVGGHLFIECEYVDDLKVFLTYAQAVDALQKYSAFQAADVGDPATPPATFEVEFEADGDAALDRYLEAGGKLGM
jgi:hypothetical protein